MGSLHHLTPPIPAAPSRIPARRLATAFPPGALPADPDLAELRALRRRIEDQIEADLTRIDTCLALLDAMDGDADLEPTMGDTDGHTDEAEGDGACGDADFEPSLGWSATGATGAPNGCPATLDLEAEAEDEDDELEAGDDTGIGDLDGLTEQGASFPFDQYGDGPTGALRGGSGL